MQGRYLKIYPILLVGLLLTQTSSSALRVVAAAQVERATDIERRNRGIELYRQGEFSEASKVLQSAVKENKTDEWAWYYLGLALLRQPKKLKDATKAFETAVSLRPNFAQAHVSLAHILLARNKLSEAVREAYAALNVDPSLAEAHYILGLIRINSGDAEAALTEAREAIRLKPEFSHAHLLLSQALLSRSAIRSIGSRPFTKTSASPLTPEQRAERLQRRLDEAVLFKEARASLETYLRLNPSDPSAELWREQLATLQVYGDYTGDKINVDETVVPGHEITSKARVISKPEPRYTEPARMAQITGTVRLRAVFSSDGTVRHILVLTGLPEGLTEESIRAARRIKFLPATINGRAVSMFVQIEYNFNL